MAIELLPPSDGNDLYFDQTDDIGFVRVDDIDVGERLRAVDKVWAKALGMAMRREGQATPIVVCRLPGRAKWTLVAGAHRVEGAKDAGIGYLKAEIISPRTDERAQREISENLWRRGLDPLDRAAFIAKLVEIARLRAGVEPDATAQQIAANARWSREKALKEAADMQATSLSHAYGWSNEVADELGVDRRTIYRALQIYRAIPPSQVAKLREARSPVLQSAAELLNLSKLEPEVMEKVVGVLASGQASRVAVAHQLIAPKAQKDPEVKRLSAFLGAFSRMSLAEKKGALAHLAGQLPAGFALVDPDSEKKPNRMRLITIGGALDRAFNVVTDLIDGEEAVDDERLGDVAGDLQTALADITEFLGGRS